MWGKGKRTWLLNPLSCLEKNSDFDVFKGVERVVGLSLSLPRNFGNNISTVSTHVYMHTHNHTCSHETEPDVFSVCW